jgi:uncharacterized protein YydD (DUF2326 family)
MPEGYLKKRNLFEKIDLITEPVPPEVKEWAEFQIQCSKIERQKKLTDVDIRSQLEMLFCRINTERLTDREKNQYAAIVMKFGL